MSSSKESSTVESLPEIPKTKPSLVEASGKRSARSTPSRLEDSGLDLKESFSCGYSTRGDFNCSNRSLVSSGGAGISPPGMPYTPSPPPGGPILRNGGTSPSPRGQPQLRRVRAAIINLYLTSACYFLYCAVVRICAVVSRRTRSEGANTNCFEVFAGNAG